MTATPADIAKFTSDGVLLTKESIPLKAAHPDALESGESEIEMFYDSSANGQTMLDERFTIQSKVSGIHEGIEIDQSLALGTVIALTPTVPSLRVIDDSRAVDVVARTRAFAYDMEVDRYSVEVLE